MKSGAQVAEYFDFSWRAAVTMGEQLARDQRSEFVLGFMMDAVASMQCELRGVHRKCQRARGRGAA